MTLLDIPHDEVCEVGEDQCPVRSVVVVQGGPQCPPVLLRLFLCLQVDSQDKHDAPRLYVCLCFQKVMFYEYIAHLYY